MAFKRYDGFYSKSLQEKFDGEMATCPFCGCNPHWLLDLKSGLTKGSVTCMCEKCGAKLYTESSTSGWNDNLLVVDVGNRNINNLAVNGTYHIKMLGNTQTQFSARGSDIFDTPLNTPTSAFSGCSDTLATDVQNAAPMPAVPQSSAATKSPLKNIWVWLGTAAIVILIVMLSVIFGLRGCSSFEDNKMKKFAEDSARQVISETLKSPSTAIWNEVSYMEDNNGKFIIYVDVEAQNSFGAYLRNKYFVIITNIDLKKETFSYNKLFSHIECQGKDDTYNLNLIKSMNNYNSVTNEDSESY